MDQLTVEQAQANVDAEAANNKAEKDRLKELKASKKEADKNLKAAVKYNAALAADAEGKAEADQTEEGWKAEVARIASEIETLEASIAGSKERLDASKTALKEAKAAAKAAEKPEKAPKEERVTQNGQIAPREGSISSKLWSIFDATAARLGRCPAIAEVIEEARAAGVVDGSIKAGYGHWRKFHGVSGRVRSQAQIDAEAEKAAEKQRKAEEKAQKDAAAAAAAAAPPAAPAPAE